MSLGDLWRVVLVARTWRSAWLYCRDWHIPTQLKVTELHWTCKVEWLDGLTDSESAYFLIKPHPMRSASFNVFPLFIIPFLFTLSKSTSENIKLPYAYEMDTILCTVFYQKTTKSPKLLTRKINTLIPDNVITQIALSFSPSAILFLLIFINMSICYGRHLWHSSTRWFLLSEMFICGNFTSTMLRFRFMMKSLKWYELDYLLYIIQWLFYLSKYTSTVVCAVYQIEIVFFLWSTEFILNFSNPND